MCGGEVAEGATGVVRVDVVYDTHREALLCPR